MQSPISILFELRHFVSGFIVVFGLVIVDARTVWWARVFIVNFDIFS